jgi:hypothetical protein
MSMDQVGHPHDELTHATPVKTMRDPIFRLVGVRNHPLVDVLCLGVVAGITPTVVDMNMPPHGRAHQIAEHRGTVVI